MKKEEWVSRYSLDSEEQTEEMLTMPCETEPLKPSYYLKCTGFWPVFRDTGSYSYGTTEVCSYREVLDVSSQEEADHEAEKRNKEGFVCPICSKKARLKGVTGFELYNEEKLLKGINHSALHMG